MISSNCTVGRWSRSPAVRSIKTVGSRVFDYSFWTCSSIAARCTPWFTDFDGSFSWNVSCRRGGISSCWFLDDGLNLPPRQREYAFHDTADHARSILFYLHSSVRRMEGECSEMLRTAILGTQLGKICR